MSWAEFLERLEAHGFTREIAGEDDFNAALGAIRKMQPPKPSEPSGNAHPFLCPRLPGLIVAGKYGVGKTCLVEAITQALSLPTTEVNLANPDDLEMLDSRWMVHCSRNLYERNVILDDLGAESAVSEYGVRKEPVADFIIRYHLIGRKRLFITTNLNTEEIDARYGGRLLSRLKDLCVPLRLSGNDKRQWKL